MLNGSSTEAAESGARLAIRLLQDAAERGDLDPWDVDVIAVVDGFLDQLRQRIEVPERVAAVMTGQGALRADLADSSEAFLAASVLVGLKAEILEASILPPPRRWRSISKRNSKTRVGWIHPSTCLGDRSAICSAGLWHHRRCGGL